MPLGATKLYLFGISVDQQFRTEYLTRLTDTAALHDMTYIGLPPFYPPGWFWIGGRLAALTGTPAWEMFKPWAITSITVAVVVALVLWAAMIRFEYALIVTTATAAATLAYSPAEPYAADHHRAAAARCWCWPGRVCAAGPDRTRTAAGRRSSASASSSASPRCSTPCCSATARSRVVADGAAAGRRAPAAERWIRCCGSRHRR